MQRLNRNPFRDYAEAPPSESEWIAQQAEIDAREQRIARQPKLNDGSDWEGDDLRDRGIL